jgi:hypothetical protein
LIIGERIPNKRCKNWGKIKVKRDLREEIDLLDTMVSGLVELKKKA